MSEALEPLNPVWNVFAAHDRALFEAEQQAHVGFWSVVLTARTFKGAIVKAAKTGDWSRVGEMAYAFPCAVAKMTDNDGGDAPNPYGPNRWAQLVHCTARTFDGEIAKWEQEDDHRRVRDLAVELADLIERIYTTWSGCVGRA